MNSIDRKLRYLENIARLRRALRDAPGNQDIVRVRRDLEEDLGETVSRRVAARFLGVSHTALERWIKSRDIPVVFAPSGRREVPVQALLALDEKVIDERERDSENRYVLNAVFSDSRERARRLGIGELVSDVSLSGEGHGPAELRGLAYHRALAPQVDRDKISEARYRVWKWSDEGKLDPRYERQWESILLGPLTLVRNAISEDSPSASDLRQNSPFAGMLSEAERRHIHQSLS